MTRYWFGAGVSDWTFTTQDGVDGVDDVAQVAGGATVTLWNAETGGTQIADLLDEDGVAVALVTSSDGTDGRAVGTIPPFQGPDGATELWASAGGGPRSLLTGRLGSAVAAAAAQAAVAVEGLTAHIAAPNPHATATTDLTDFATETATDGQVPVFDEATGLWTPTTSTGLNPADFVNTDGGSEITIPAGDVTTKALVIRIPPGDRAEAVNTVEVWWNAGTEAVPNWQLVTRLNEYGEFRGQPRGPASVFGRVKQYNASQTGNLWEFTDYANNPLSWVDAAGRMRAPNLGITPVWNQDTGTAGVGTYRFYNPTGGPLVLRGFIVSAGGTAPNGDFIINPKLDGVAVYASGNRPKITAGQRTSGLVTTLATTTWPAGSYLTVDVDSVPSTAPTKVTIQAVAY